MRCSRLFILFILLFAPPGAYAMTGDKADFQKLADGVYAFVGKLNDANAMAIVTTQGVVVVDTGNNPPETRILQKFIQSVTTQPIRYVVITQNHGDHTGGTPLFSPPATVIVQDKVAKDWAAMKDYQVRSWQKRFPERAEALKGVSPLDTVVSFSDRMTLHVGGKAMELLYIDDTYNPGDVAVWLPDSGIMHAGFVGYIGRHPDIRPDYSHGTTSDMLEQLRTAHVTITKIAEEGRFLTATTDDGKELHLRAAGDVDFEGIKDRSELALGMKLKVIYLEPAEGNAPLGFDITELEIERN
jgi:glyoxylase-like metal-dependent hydrolase (beta-lactamase superfamily II)